MCSEPAAAENAAVAGGKSDTGLVALHVATGLELGEGEARLVDGLAGGALGDLERGADLRVRETAQLTHQNRATLALGEPRQVAHEVADALAHRGLAVGARRRGGVVLQ